MKFGRQEQPAAAETITERMGGNPALPRHLQQRARRAAEQRCGMFSIKEGLVEGL